MGESPKYYAKVIGPAGTGKSFVLHNICTITKLCTGLEDSTEVLAPTGGSASNCSGSVVDRVCKVNRSGTKFKFLPEDINTLVLLQNRYKNMGKYSTRESNKTNSSS